MKKNRKPETAQILVLKQLSGQLPTSSGATLLLIIEILLLANGAGMSLPIVTMMTILFGFLVIILGSIMPFMKRNTTMGIRLPWTIASDGIWKKTYEHDGPVFIVGGVLIIISSPLAGMWAISFMVAVIVGISFYLAIWSYCCHGKRLRFPERKDGTE